MYYEKIVPVLVLYIELQGRCIDKNRMESTMNNNQSAHYLVVASPLPVFSFPF